MRQLWGVARANGALSRKFESVAERTIAQTGIADLEAVRASRLVDFQRRLLKGVVVVVDFVVIYVVITFVLRRFPYTSPWGESMRGFLLATLQNLGLGILSAMPGLFTVFLIFVLARFLARLIGFWFRAVERGRVKVRWIYPETAQPTRRLLTALLWLFAVVMAYPYLPGSGTDAFKGVSVFLGLMLTFGSSGLVNQIMSGFMVTYSRALRLGDFVRIGDVEGTVTHLGVLSTKIRTPFSRRSHRPQRRRRRTDDHRLLAARRFGRGVFTPTSVTIGYDAPWRQVQSLLLLAAERTPGLRQDPKPMVLQTALEDFYVRYTLLVCLDRQESRPFTLHALHSHIQDLFNEYGVQIMSPNYFLDPAAPKVVAKKDWFAAPASPDPSRIVPSVRQLT